MQIGGIYNQNRKQTIPREIQDYGFRQGLKTVFQHIIMECCLVINGNTSKLQFYLGILQHYINSQFTPPLGKLPVLPNLKPAKTTFKHIIKWQIGTYPS